MVDRHRHLVEHSRLSYRLKTLALVLLMCGADDGTAIRPSIRRVADRWGRSVRRAQAAISDLQRLGVLVVVRTRAPGRPTEYRLNLDRLAALKAPRGVRP